MLLVTSLFSPLTSQHMSSPDRRSASVLPPQFAVADPPLAAGATSYRGPSTPTRQRPSWAVETPTLRRFHEEIPLSQHPRPPCYVQVQVTPSSTWARDNWPGRRVVYCDVHGTEAEVQKWIISEKRRWGLNDFEFDSWYERRRYSAEDIELDLLLSE